MKRFTAMLLSVLMLVSLLPVSALADETAEEAHETVETVIEQEAPAQASAETPAEPSGAAEAPAEQPEPETEATAEQPEPETEPVAEATAETPEAEPAATAEPSAETTVSAEYPWSDLSDADFIEYVLAKKNAKYISALLKKEKSRECKAFNARVKDIKDKKDRGEVEEYLLTLMPAEEPAEVTAEAPETVLEAPSAGTEKTEQASEPEQTVTAATEPEAAPEQEEVSEPEPAAEAQTAEPEQTVTAATEPEAVPEQKEVSETDPAPEEPAEAAAEEPAEVSAEEPAVSSEEETVMSAPEAEQDTEGETAEEPAPETAGTETAASASAPEAEQETEGPAVTAGEDTEPVPEQEESAAKASQTEGAEAPAETASEPEAQTAPEGTAETLPEEELSEVSGFAEMPAEPRMAFASMPLLGAAPCAHEALGFVERVEPTCAKAGNIEYWQCADCLKRFTDITCATELSEEDTVLSPVAHTFGQDHICTVCGAEQIAVAVEITGYSVTYDGKKHTASAVLTGDIPTGFTYEITLKNDALTDAGNGTAGVQSVVIYDKSGSIVTENFIVDASATAPVAIAKAVYYVETASADKVYNSAALTDPTAAVMGLVNGETASVTANGTITDVGTAANTCGEITWGTAKESNYTHGTDRLGTLTVSPKAVTITAYNGGKVYDSLELIQPAFGISSSLESGDDHRFDVRMIGESTITDIGTRPNVIGTVDGVAVSSAAATAVGNYIVTTADGTLTVNPKAVTITAKDAAKTYDGTALEEPGFTATELELGDFHTFTVVMTDESTITDVGTQPNVIATVDGVPVVSGEATAVGNYIVTTADGTLTVNPLAVIASGTCGKDLNWELTEDGTLTVTGTGETLEGNWGDHAREIKKVLLPDSIKTISLDVFSGCDKLTSVTIPSGVKSIGSHVFCSCRNLTSVTISEGVESIGESAFTDCGMTTVTIPASVKNIGSSAFELCAGLTSVTISEGVESIGSYAFASCGLTSVTIPASVTAIGDSAFCYCKGLSKATFAGDPPASFGKAVFKTCASGFTVYYPLSRVFAWAPNGETTRNGYPVESYTDDAVAATGTCGDDLNWVLTTDGTLAVTGTGETLEGNWDGHENDIRQVLLPNSIKTIGKSAFGYCENLTSVTIPANVESIGDRAFDNCRNMTSVTISEGVESIGSHVFEACKNLTTVTIPASVKSIGGYAFLDCFNLTSVTILEGVESIGRYAFDGCGNLTSVTVPASVKSIGKEAFNFCTDLSEAIFAGDPPAEFGEDVFKKCDSGLTVYYPLSRVLAWAPKGETSWNGYPIEAYEDEAVVASGGCGMGLTWVLTDDGTLIVTGRGETLWRGDWDDHKGDIKKVLLPDSIKTISLDAFSGCDKLTSVTIPSGVESIGNSAFFSCNSLTSVTIPSGVTSIGREAFSFCTSLSKATFAGDPPASFERDVFEYCGPGFKICYPLSRVSAWAPNGETTRNGYPIECYIDDAVAASGTCGTDLIWGLTTDGTLAVTGTGKTLNGNWDGHESDIKQVLLPGTLKEIGDAFNNCVNLTSVTIPEGVESIGEMAFFNCLNLTSVTIPEGVESIGYGAFFNCLNLTSVTIPSSVTNIGVQAFNQCTGLLSVTITEGVESIGDNAFSDCGNMTSVTIPSSVKSIGGYAFSDCGSLTSVTIPASVESIGIGAFGDCSGLTAVTIPYGVTGIGESAFAGCNKLTSITIPASVTAIGDRAFKGCEALLKATFAGDPPASFGADVFNNCASGFTVYYPLSRVLAWAPNGETTWNGYPIASYIDDAIIASGTCGDDLNWFLTDDGTLIVTGTGETLTGNWDGHGNDIRQVLLPGTLKEIGNNAFNGCEKLTSVTIPEGVESIGEMAFTNCEKLTSVTIPSSVTTVDNSAFQGCAALAAATFAGDPPATLSGSVFDDCASGFTIRYPLSRVLAWAPNGETAWNGYSIEGYKDEAAVASGTCGTDLNWVLTADGTLTVTGTGKTLAPGWGDYTGDIKKVLLPGTLKEIDNFAFSYCTELTSVTFPDSLESIGDGVLEGCDKLTSVTLPSSLKTIGKKAFSGCGLTSVTLPSSVESIDSEAFSGCGVLLKATFAGDPPASFGTEVFKSCASGFTVCYPLSRVLAWAPNGETAWNGYPVASYIDDAVAATGTCGDDLIWVLTTDGTLIVTGTGETLTGSWDGHGNDIRQVLLPGSIKTIGDYAFSACGNLTSVTIPASVESIGSYAFSNCGNLTSVTIPASVESIGNSAFCRCGNLTSVTIPASVTNIGNNAFNDCGNLTSVTIPEGVESIGDHAFDSCGKLTSVTIPSSVKSLGREAFYWCEKLTSVTITEGVESIGEKAFAKCKKLTSVTVPSSVKSIGNGAFSECTALETVRFEGGAPSFGTGVFEGPTATAYYDESETSWTEAVREAAGPDLIWKALHPEIVFVEEVTPTCTADGFAEHWECTYCHKYFSDQTGSAELTGAELILPIADNTFGEDHVCTACGTVDPAHVKVSGTCGELLDWILTDGDVLVITGTGAMADYFPLSTAPWDEYKTGIVRVVLPDGITHIGSRAFYSFDSITGISLPGNLTSIGDNAFYHCDKLASVIIPEKVTALADGIFGLCVSLETVTLPGKLKSIGEEAFRDCTSLQHISIPENVESIGRLAFCGCTSLAEIDIPDGLEMIDFQSFIGCSGLTSVSLPSNLKIIKEAVFSDCTSLEEITIPSGVESIGDRAFKNCTDLAAVRFEGGAPSVASDAFAGVTATAYYDENYASWTEEARQSIGPDMTWAVAVHAELVHVERVEPTCTADGSAEHWECSVCKVCFAEETGETVLSPADIILPAAHSFGEDHICTVCRAVEDGYAAANGTCGTDLTWVLTTGGTLVITGTGEKLEGNWDRHEGEIKKVLLPDTVKTLGNSAFVGCGLTSFTVPAGVENIGETVFYGCSSLVSLNVENGNGTFRSEGNCIIEKASGKLVCGCNGSVIPDGVTSIGDYAFLDCGKLTSVTIPSGVESIGTGAFDGCGELTSVTIPSGVKTIGDFAFYGCGKLASVMIPSGVESIGAGAFENCAELASVTIPSSVKSIGGNAFRNCTGLTSVTIAEGVESIGDNAFDTCEKLTSVTIPSSVVGFGIGAFRNCTGLTSVTIADGVQHISSSAFLGCGKLTSVTIPGSVRFIGESAFEDCDGLTSVTLSSGLQSIEGSAFLGCGKLTSVTIPSSVTNIADSAFSGCSVLSGATFAGDPPETFGSNVFDGCASGFKVLYPDTLASVWAPNGETTWNGYPIEAYHVHVAEHVDRVEPTCTEAGNIEYYKCDGCGGFFADEACETALSEAETVLAATGHGLTHYAAKDATCAQAGNCEYWYCAACEGYFLDSAGNTATTQEKTVIPTIDHTMTHTAAKDATCTEAGNCEYWYCTACEGYFLDADGNTATTQEKTVISALGHSMTHYAAKAATCTEAGNCEYWYCSVCKNWFLDADGNTATTQEKTVIAATGHSLTHYAAKDATCAQAGNCEYWYCANCEGYFLDADGNTATTQEKTVIAALGHSMTHTAAKAATCTEAGNCEYWYCSVCKNWFLDADGNTATTQEKTVIAATGHSMTHTAAKAATCTEAGNCEYWYCSVCKNWFLDADGNTATTQEKTVIAALGHSMTHTAAKAATCTEAGNCEYWYCSVCKNWFLDADGKTATTQEKTVIAALGHDLEHHDEQAPTCTEAGWDAYDACRRCDYSTYKELPALGHDMEHFEAKAATCTVPGNVEYWHCLRCGGYFLDADGRTATTQAKTVVPAAHKYGEDHICTVCGEKDPSWAPFSGTDGDAKWSISEDGVLTVTGKGKVTGKGWAANADKITSAVISEGVTDIGDGAFKGCSNLTSVTLPASVTSIGSGAFSGCSKLTSVKLPDGITSIPDNAFAGCSALRSFTVPASVTSIGSSAFADCRNMTSVTIYGGVKKIGANAFKGCSALKDVLYGGIGEQWKSVSVGSGNEPLTGARLHTMISVKVSKTKAKLTWEKMDGVRNYLLYIRMDDESMPVKTVKIKKAKYSYTMTPGHTYRFSLAPVIDGEAGMESLETVIELPLDTPKLKAKVRGNTLTVSWSKVKGADGFELSLTDSAGNTNTEKLGAKARKTKIQVTPSGVYTVSLTAYTDRTTSATATVRSTVALTASALKARAYKGKVTLTWKEVKAADAYEIYRAEGDSGEFKLIATVSTKKYVDRGVTVGTAYTYKLRPVSRNTYAYGTGPVYGLYTAAMKVTVK